MGEQSWLSGSVTQPVSEALLFFCLIFMDASTSGFPSSAKQSKESSIEEERVTFLYPESKPVPEIPSGLPLCLVT